MLDEVRDCVETLRIMERLAVYTSTLDGKDAAGWAHCFTEDGAFAQGGKVVRWREKLRAYAGIHGRALGSRHITSSPVYRIDESGRRATGRQGRHARTFTAHARGVVTSIAPVRP